MLKIIIALIFFIFCSSCKQIQEKGNSDINLAKWELYKGVNCVFENSSGERYLHKNRFISQGCLNPNLAQNEVKEMEIPNYMLVDLDLAFEKKFDTCTIYWFDMRVNGLCVLPRYAIEIPTGVKICNNKEINLIREGFVFNLAPSENKFIAYIKDHKDFLNPWLLQEAERRGVFKQ